MPFYHTSVTHRDPVRPSRYLLNIQPCFTRIEYTNQPGITFLAFSQAAQYHLLQSPVAFKPHLPEVQMNSRTQGTIVLRAQGRIGKSLLLVLTAAILFGLAGCATKRLKVDFTGFERAYASTSNQEVLLNLARLQNRDPTYFFKIGQITSAYKMAVSLSGNAGYTLQTTNVAAGSPAGSGTPSATYENDPIFTFIPVNDETNAQLLLKPVPAETFYFLYEQGWRVDQLVRLMVDRLELTRYSAESHSCTVETIRNTPPAVYLKSDGTPDTEYLRNPAALSSYATFLRINAIIYWLQRHGYLLLRGTNRFVPFSVDALSGIADATGTNAPKGADFVTAAQKGATWQLDPATQKWTLGEKTFSPIFTLYPLAGDSAKLGPDVKTVEREILADPEMQELRQGPALHEVLLALSAGFTIEGSSNQQDACNTSTGKSSVSAHLVMRSLMGLMAAAAQEQTPFDQLAQADPTIPNSPYLTPAQIAALGPPPRFLQAVPPIERLPLLRLTGTAGNEQAAPIIQLNYRGINYRIADEKATVGTDNQYWNRDVFRLIDQLTSQVTVDISKFPLTEILQ
jgi:hypothetical protein